MNKVGGESGQQQRESLLEARQPEWLETLARALGPLRPMRLRRFERVPLSPLYTRIFRERELLLLDNQGFRLAVVENFPFTPEEVFQLARAAGVPAAAYRVRCLDGQTEEILKLMFPRRKRVKRV